MGWQHVGDGRETFKVIRIEEVEVIRQIGLLCLYLLITINIFF